MRDHRRGPSWGLVVFMASIIGVPAASAFNSIPPGSSPHDQITAAGAAGLGLDPKSLEALQAAVRQVDLDDIKVKANGDHLAVLDASSVYQPAHHCDRLPPGSDAQAFAATSAYLHVEADQARQFLAAGDGVRARTALGHVLHAAQDCFSHSDIGEKDAGTQAGFESALLGDGVLPTSVRLTGFKPGTQMAEMPPGDPYPHGSFAKDSPNGTDDASRLLPDGRTKYQAARDLATHATAAFLSSFMAELAPDQQALLRAAPPTKHPSPLPTVPLLLGSVLGVAWGRRRRLLAAASAKLGSRPTGR